MNEELKEKVIRAFFVKTGFLLGYVAIVENESPPTLAVGKREGRSTLYRIPLSADGVVSQSRMAEVVAVRFIDELIPRPGSQITQENWELTTKPFLKALAEIGSSFAQCIECGGTENLRMNRGMEVFCPNHWKDTPLYCNECGYWTDEWNEDWDMCNECYRARIVSCDNCGTEAYREDTIAFHESRYCEECAAECLTECIRCGRNILIEDAEWNDYEEGYVCENCSQRPLLSYDANPLEVLGKDSYGDPPKDGILYGIELEVEASSSISYMIDQLKPLVGNFSIFKEDGSISSTRGIEICSLPMTVKSHKKAWKIFFEHVPSGLSSWKSGRCGIHIHITRSPLGTLRLGKMLVFLNDPANKRLVSAIAGRYSESGYSKRKDKKLTDALLRGEDKYEMLNLCHTKTVEMRIFRGTLNPDHFFADLEFAEALVKFCLNAGLRDTNQKRFMDFLETEKKLFPYLWKFFSGKSYIPTIQEEDEV